MGGEGVMGEVGGKPASIQFPVRVTFCGVPAVVIPEAEYQALTERRTDIPAGRRLSRLDKNAEVRAFIVARLGTDDVENIRRAAIAQFGEESVPSRSALNRFVIRRRAADALKRPGKRTRKAP